jgi:holliday junction DNA helicase RuvB
VLSTPEGGDTLRALSFDEYVGQEPLKRRLAVHIQAAVADQRMLDHVLLAGPPGYGKTSVAQIIARDLGDPFACLTMPVKPVALASLLRQWGGGILLLDEIHRASASQQEDLLNLLQDGYLQTPSGRRVEVQHLTIIGATTEPDKIIAPLYDRFPIKPTFVDYSDDEMADIVMGMADKVGLELDPAYALALGQASGGIPRNARQLVLATRDLYISTGRDPIIADVLELCGTESDGLSAGHVEYLRHLADLGGHAGLQILATMLRLHPSIVCELERLLVKRQLVMYSSVGRELTELGFRRVARRGLQTAGPTRLRAAQEEVA